MRYDHVERRTGKTYNELSPRMALIFMQPRWGAKLCYSTSLVEISFKRRIRFSNDGEDERLQPEYSRCWQLTLWGKQLLKGLNAEVNAYHNTSENMDFMGYGSNIGTMKSIGMEISADYTYRKLVLHGNASWLRRSRRVAYAIMDYMQDNGLSRNDVAEKLGVSPQYVSKILSGKVNFSFKTISEIEEGLGIEVFQAAAMEA